MMLACDDESSSGPIAAGEHWIGLDGWAGAGLWQWECTCGDVGPFVEGRTAAIIGAYDHADRHIETSTRVDPRGRVSRRVHYRWPAA